MSQVMRRSTISITLAGLAACASAGAWAEPPAKGREVDERRVVDADATVRVDNVAGRVSVEAWDEPEVQVKGRLGAGIERLEIEGTGRDLSIRVVYPRFGNSEGAELRVKVPKAARVEVRTVSADVSVAGAEAALRVQTVSGDVGVRREPAELEVRTVSGDVRVEPAQGGTGAAMQRLEVETVSGEVDVRAAAVRKVQLRTVSGDVLLEAGLAAGSELELESKSGDLELRTNEGVPLATDLDTRSGDVTNELGSVRDTSGAARVSMSTLSGDVKVRRPTSR